MSTKKNSNPTRYKCTKCQNTNYRTEEIKGAF